MKLRLENLESITVLSVTEGISPQDLPVLSAGIRKIIQEQEAQGRKKPIALDLSSIDESQLGENFRQEVPQLRAIAASAEIALTLISPIPGVGDVAGIDSVESFFASPASRLMMIEFRLKAHYRSLQDHQAKLEEEIEKGQKAISGDVKSLRRQNSELKARAAHLEALIQRRLQARKPPAESKVFSAKLEAAKRIAATVLEQEGILPVI